MVLKIQSSKKISPSVLISRFYASLVEFYTLCFSFHKAFTISLQRSKFSSFFSYCTVGISKSLADFRQLTDFRLFRWLSVS